LNSEFKALSTQADSRAKLDYLRTEVKTKSAEIKALYVDFEDFTDTKAERF